MQRFYKDASLSWIPGTAIVMLGLYATDQGTLTVSVPSLASCRCFRFFFELETEAS
jgi:hypothetical protein